MMPGPSAIPICPVGDCNGPLSLVDFKLVKGFRVASAADLHTQQRQCSRTLWIGASIPETEWDCEVHDFKLLVDFWVAKPRSGSSHAIGKKLRQWLADLRTRLMICIAVHMDKYMSQVYMRSHLDKAPYGLQVAKTGPALCSGPPAGHLGSAREGRQCLVQP